MYFFRSIITCLHFIFGSVTISNSQIECSQSTNFSGIQDGAGLNQAVFRTKNFEKLEILDFAVCKCIMVSWNHGPNDFI